MIGARNCMRWAWIAPSVAVAVLASSQPTAMAMASQVSLDLGTISFGLGAGDYRIGGSIATDRKLREWLTVDAKLGLAATGFRSGVTGLFGSTSLGLTWRTTALAIGLNAGAQALYFKCAYCYLVNGVAPFGGASVTYTSGSVPWSDGLRFNGEVFEYNDKTAWSMTAGPVWALGK